jgi:hypothetical protein
MVSQPDTEVKDIWSFCEKRSFFLSVFGGLFVCGKEFFSLVCLLHNGILLGMDGSVQGFITIMPQGR